MIPPECINKCGNRTDNGKCGPCERLEFEILWDLWRRARCKKCGFEQGKWVKETA